MICFFAYHVWMRVKKKKPERGISSTQPFKKWEKPRAPFIVVRKPSLSQVSQLEYRNFTNGNTVSPAGSHMCSERYYP